MLAHYPAESETKNSSQNHARSENGLSQGAVVLGEGVGNERLGGGGVGSFANANEGAGQNEHGKCRGQAAGNRGKAPKDYAGSDDFGLVEAVGKIPGRNAGQSEHDEKHHLQGAQLRIAYAEVLAQKGHKGIQDLAIGEVDKID
jgi:hypothetical protein